MPPPGRGATFQGHAVTREGPSDPNESLPLNGTERDLDLVYVVLNSLWAPTDGDPQAAAGMFSADEPLTTNDVIRARRAMRRLRERLRVAGDLS